MIRFLLSLVFSLAFASTALPQAMLGGSGAPVNSTGSEGQFYFNKANGNIYGPKAFGAWPTPPTTPAIVPTVGCTTLNVLYNNASSLGCMAGTSWDNTNRSLTVAGATVTTSNPLLNFSQTWNNVATDFSLLDFSVTNTNSGAGSSLIRFVINSANVFSVSKTGAISGGSTADFTGSITSINGAMRLTDPGGYFRIGGDTFFARSAAAAWRMGDVDAAAPVAQTLGVQGVVAGTSNTAGAAWTQKGSLSTGSGIGGDIIFQTSAANAAATTKNAGVTVLTLKGSATTTNNPGRVLVAGQIESSGSPPTAAGSGGTCATDGIAGGANAGTVTLSAACAATNTITLTFKTASATGWSCFANDRGSATTLINETSTTTTTAVLTVSGVTSGATDVIQYACTAY